MKLIAIASAAALLALAGPAGAAGAEAAVTAAIKAFGVALNSGKPVGPFMTSTQTVIDEFAPHHWSGPEGAKKWAADFGVFMQKNAMSEPGLTMGDPSRLEQDGAHAYAIVPTVFTFKQNGKAMAEKGTMTFALDHTATGWKVASFSWSGPRATPKM
jgi:hypothetical protein